jgi:asparagine synthase (glutamine-hydrolysing)
MCGIAGLLTDNIVEAKGMAVRMAATLAHRGPDAQGAWEDREAGLAFGHARLAIRDLTPTGAQPMVSASERFAIAYNGELYNAEDMRAAMPGQSWRGTSDTEVLLEACARFGIEAALGMTNGIFAFALWDRTTRTLALARDRLGVKPIYWASFPGLFLFGSEMKALEAHPGFERELNREALAAFLRLSYVPSPLSIWRQAHKLEPGGLLILELGRAPRLSRWWHAGQALRDGLARQGKQSLPSLAEEIDHLLADAVRRQTVSDVPIGAFLSGGLDSTAIVTHLASLGGAPVKTFTMRFNEGGYDEGSEAAQLARHLGADHHERFVTADDALALVGELPRIYDEPFADSSQIPTLLMSRFARSHVTVALSGDGGDEMFAGYNRHIFTVRSWPYLRLIPSPLRVVAAGFLGLIAKTGCDALGQRLGVRQMSEKLQKLSALLPLSNLAHMHDLLAAQGLTREESPLYQGGKTLLADRTASPYLAQETGGLSPLDHMQLLDIQNYMPDDVLTKVDRASMSCGLEVRVPLLDHRLFALAFALPSDQRVAGGKGKVLLRRALGLKLAPSFFSGKPKAGFAVPIDQWLKGPLKEWAWDLVSPNQAQRQGLFDRSKVTALWNDHQSGRRKRHHVLWNLLMFQAWQRERGGAC